MTLKKNDSCILKLYYVWHLHLSREQLFFPCSVILRSGNEKFKRNILTTLVLAKTHSILEAHSCLQFSSAGIRKFTRKQTRIRGGRKSDHISPQPHSFYFCVCFRSVFLRSLEHIFAFAFDLYKFSVLWNIKDSNSTVTVTRRST